MLEDRGKLEKLKLLLSSCWVFFAQLSLWCVAWGWFVYAWLDHFFESCAKRPRILLRVVAVAVTWLIENISGEHGERISLPLLTGLKVHWSQHEGAENHWTFKSSALTVFSFQNDGSLSAMVQGTFFLDFFMWALPWSLKQFQLISASQESQFILGRLEVSVYPRNPKQPLGQPWGHDESSMPWGDFFLQRLEAMDMTMLSLDRFQNFHMMIDDWRLMIDDWWLMKDFLSLVSLSFLRTCPLHTCSFRNQAIGRWSIAKFQAETGYVGGLMLHWDGSICRFRDSFF